MKSKGKIIVSGIAFWYPLAGVAWQFLHYLLGLKELGYDVYYVEDSAREVYDPYANEFTPDPRANVHIVERVFASYDLKDKWCFRSHAQNRCFGMSEAELKQLYRDADVFLNVTGAQEIREEHMGIPRRIYVETDPVVSQIKVSQGDAPTIAHLSAHDMHFTYGENIGQADCLLPTGGFHWLPTRQPVFLQRWRNDLAAGDSYTTVATWKNKGRDIVYRGETYHWSKDLEFEKFLELPRRTRARFELATTPEPDAALKLIENGWRLVPSVELSLDWFKYRRFIQSSRGEFTVAKDQNIRLKSGWFSDRSACYLAAGRPVITQETGFSNHLPVGRGLFGFVTMEEVLGAINRIESDYQTASRAAREIAREYFSAEKVLESLLGRAGL